MRQNSDSLDRSARVRKVAKVWSTISIAFVLFVAIGELVFPHEGDVEADIPLFEWMLVLLFPVIPVIGLALAWRWELLGSSIALVSSLLFIIIISFDRERILTSLMVAELAVVFPAILYLMCWNIERKEGQLVG